MRAHSPTVDITATTLAVAPQPDVANLPGDYTTEEQSEKRAHRAPGGLPPSGPCGPGEEHGDEAVERKRNQG